ncbi:MAG: POTRA domain-containing protein [Trueperaceae bacterium]|nr:POTRA domain-containing protein [Trueperaceae bacterium]
MHPSPFRARGPHADAPPARRPVASFLVALLAALAPFAVAQAPEVRGPVAEVRVEGTETYADIVRTLVTTRPGTPAERVDLEAERNRVYGLGTFATVSVSLDPGRDGPVLVVRVEENPVVGEVVFDGVEALSTSRLSTLVADEHLLAPGRVFNTGRADDAVATIQSAYRAEGFPFDPDVRLETEVAPELADRGEDPPLRVRYRVNETARLDTVVFEDLTVFTPEELAGSFAAVEQQDAFDLALYRAAVRRVAERYEGLGYRGSGVDLEATTLRGGRLEVHLRELRIAAIDTTPLGIDADALSLAPGDLFDYDAVLEDVRRLASGRTGDVRLVPRVNADGGVRVGFELGPPDTAGAIDAVRIEGNTVLDDATLRDALALGEGDTFTSTVAEEDYRRIVEAYEREGYLIASEPDFTWVDGTYVVRIREYTVGQYRLDWAGADPTARDFVVLRRLPDVGSVVSLDAIDDALRGVLQEGAVRPVDRRILPPEGDDADAVTVEIVVEAAQTGLFQPAASYSTLDGFSASLALSDVNLWGRAHTVEGELDARNGDVGFLLGGSVRYEVPWLYLDAPFFRDRPTSASLRLFSDVASNERLSTGGSTSVRYPGLDGGPEVAIGEYTRRTTGFGVGVGRALADDLSVRLRARASQVAIDVEPPDDPCEVENGVVDDPENCSLPRDLAEAYAPVDGAAGFVGADLTYDARDRPAYPRDGVAANASVGVGFGNDFEVDGDRRGYVFVPVEAGTKGYLTLENLTGGAVADDAHVFAARLNVGSQFGSDYPDAERFTLGQTLREATQVRGFADDDFDLTRSYATTSLEYRYDFQLTTVATQTLIGVVFGDAAWSSGADDAAGEIVASGGLGVQVNLGFSGVALPALRFDYGWSERNPSGVFTFRIGNVF